MATRGGTEKEKALLFLPQTPFDSFLKIEESLQTKSSHSRPQLLAPDHFGFERSFQLLQDPVKGFHSSLARNPAIAGRGWARLRTEEIGQACIKISGLPPDGIGQSREARNSSSPCSEGS
jgi:hypothetical protein